MIRFRCQACGKKLKADDSIIGRKVKCTRCGKVETVPPFDDLTKPATKQDPDLISVGDSDAESNPDPDVAADDDYAICDSLLGDDSAPVEMDVQINTDVEVNPDRRQFKLLERKPLELRRYLPFGIAGMVLMTGLIVLISSGWLFPSGPMFDSEFEALPAVANYRRAQNQLEKSRRVMMVMAESMISQEKLTEDDINELNEFNDTILLFSKKIDTLKKASELVDLGEKAAANQLLTQEANIMDDRKPDVDRRTEQFSQ